MIGPIRPPVRGDRTLWQKLLRWLTRSGKMIDSGNISRRWK